MLRFIALFVSLLIANPVVAATHVALHATQVEIDEWNLRKVNGPYKDGYDRIIANADAFVASPNADWAGHTEDDCYDPFANSRPGRQRDVGMRDAAFIYMLTGNTAYLNPVVTKLLSQVAVAGVDFSNTTKWCLSSAWFDIANWVRMIAYAYSYAKPGIAGANQTTIEAWLTDAAEYFDNAVHVNSLSLRFPNRDTDDYSECATSPDNFTSGNCPGKLQDMGGNGGTQYYGGPQVRQFHEAWNNQSGSRIALVAAVGVITNNTALKARAKRFVQEWVRYAVYSTGSVIEQYRWGSGHLSHCYSYPASALGSVITIVDHLARDGDTSLYEYTTSEGMYDTEGGPKSLLTALQRFAGKTNGTVLEYNTTSAENNGVAGYLCDTTYTNPPSLSAGNAIDHVFLANNIFYKDTAVQQAYSTTLPGSWMTGGYESRSGEWGILPDIRFMYGGMENISDAFEVVSPPGETPVVEAVSATSLSVDPVTTHTIALPACDANQRLVVLMGIDFTATATWPVDWTQLHAPVVCDSDDCQLETRTFAATGSQGTSINVTTDLARLSAAHAWCLSSQHANAPEAAATVGVGTGTTPDPPLLTPVADADLWIAGTVFDFPATVSAYPTNYSNGVSTTSTGGGESFQMASARRHLTAASEDPGTFTLSAARFWASVTIGVRAESTPDTHTFTQSRTRFHAFYNTSEASPEVLAAENQSINVAPQSRFRLRAKIQGEIADPPSINLQLRYSKNGGAYTALTDAFANGIKASGTHPDAIANSTPTTELLTEDEITFVASVVSMTSAAVTLNLTQDSEAEIEQGIALDDTVAVGDTFDFRFYQDDGTALDAYDVTPRVTIVPYAAGAGF